MVDILFYVESINSGDSQAVPCAPSQTNELQLTQMFPNLPVSQTASVSQKSSVSQTPSVSHPASLSKTASVSHPASLSQTASVSDTNITYRPTIVEPISGCYAPSFYSTLFDDRTVSQTPAQSMFRVTPPPTTDKNKPGLKADMSNSSRRNQADVDVVNFKVRRLDLPKPSDTDVIKNSDTEISAKGLNCLSDVIQSKAQLSSDIVLRQTVPSCPPQLQKEATDAGASSFPASGCDKNVSNCVNRFKVPLKPVHCSTIRCAAPFSKYLCNLKFLNIRYSPASELIYYF